MVLLNGLTFAEKSRAGRSTLLKEVDWYNDADEELSSILGQGNTK
jgi:hypothetical protein